MQDHLSDIKYLLSTIVMAWEESTQPWLCPESQGFLTRLTLKINWGGFGVMDLQNQVKEMADTWWSSVWAPMRTKNMGSLTGGRQESRQKHQNGSKSGESLCQSQLLSFLNVRSTLQAQALGGCCLHQHAMNVVLCFSCNFRKSFSYNFPCSFQKEIQKSSFHHCIWTTALNGGKEVQADAWCWHWPTAGRDCSCTSLRGKILYFLLFPLRGQAALLDFCFGLDASLHLAWAMNPGYSLHWGKAKEFSGVFWVVLVFLVVYWPRPVHGLSLVLH